MLANLFSSKILFKILEVLFAEPNKKFSTTEIITTTNKKQANVSRELDKLVKWQMVLKTKDNGQNYYQVNQAYAEFAALKNFFKDRAAQPLYLLYNEEDNVAFLPLNYIIGGFSQDHSVKAGLLSFVPNTVAEFKNNYLRFYLEQSEAERLTNEALEKLLNHPEKVTEVIQKYILESGQEVLQIFNSLSKKEFQINSEVALEIGKKLENILVKQCSYGLVGFLDSRTYAYSNYVKSYLDKKTKNTEIRSNYAMEKLLSPSFITFTQQLRMEMLTLTLQNKEDKRETENLERKWGWLNFGYRGPGLEATFFDQTMKELRTKDKKELKKELESLQHYQEDTEKEKIKVFNQLNVDGKHRKFIQALSLISYLKIYRKDIVFLGTYIIFRLLKNFDKSLSFSNLCYLKIKEVEEIFCGRLKAKSSELTERERLCVYLAKEDRLLIGEAAEKFMKELPIEKEKDIDRGTIKQLDGNTACLGKTGDWVYGKVRIINTPDDMKKMEAGDILVSMATTPDILPAMKKAVAIVTDHGGITCHAAIVSRELNIPCLIGTRYATKVFKDGDQAVVCPRHGYIKFAA